MAVIGFEWNQQDDIVNHLSLIENKTLILSNGEYKKWNKGREAEYKTGNAVPVQTSTNSNIIYNFTEQVSSPIYKVFDGVQNEIGTSIKYSDLIGAEIGYIFQQNKIISKYTIVNSTHITLDGRESARAIKSWNLKGSLDGNIWDILDVRENETNWKNGEVRNYYFNNTKGYTQYKIKILSNNGDTWGSQISEIIFHEVATDSTDSHWSTVSSTLPNSTQFIEQGMDSLSPLLDRTMTTLEPQSMTQDIAWSEGGKVFKKTINLKKYFDIRSINVTN